jgi:hypothetical protein
MLLGASVYDKLFIGFEVISVRRGILNVHVSSDSVDSFSKGICCTWPSLWKRAVKSVTLHPR